MCQQCCSKKGGYCAVSPHKLNKRSISKIDKKMLLFALENSGLVEIDYKAAHDDSPVKRSVLLIKGSLSKDRFNGICQKDQIQKTYFVDMIYGISLSNPALATHHIFVPAKIEKFLQKSCRRKNPAKKLQEF